MRRVNSDPYQNLANSIVEQALSDYWDKYKMLKRHPHNDEAKWELERLERFFLSRWCAELMEMDDDFDNNLFLEKIREMAELRWQNGCKRLTLIDSKSSCNKSKK